MRAARLLLVAAAVALGVVAEWVAFGWNDPLHWVPDLVVGWTFIGCGLVATRRWPDNLSGPLMIATGFSWFLGNFVGVDNDFVATAAANAAFVHRGPLIHLVLAYPAGRLPGPLERGAVMAGYAASFIEPVWRSDGATIVLAVLLVLVGAREFLGSVGRTRRARAVALLAAAAFSLVLVGGAIARLIAGTAVGLPTLIAYQLVLVSIGGGLFAGLVLAPWKRADVVDLVLELGQARSGTLRSQLARALGDPSLQVGYWVADTNAFVDVEGRTLALPREDSDRSVTIVRRGEEPVAAIVHDSSVLGDPGLVEAVSSAAQLGASNVRLHAELQRRVAELVESRRRIMEAGDEERGRLERRLDQGAKRRLNTLAHALERAMSSATGEATRDQIARARDQLERTLDEIQRIALGLHPRVLFERGLAEALRGLAESFPIPVTLDVTAEHLPTRIEAVAYFVCSEALANVAKHARASSVRVSVTQGDDLVTVRVEDDGAGGADTAGGSGLRGLADRVETIGGTFEVRSAPEQGTRLTAEIPLGGEEDESPVTR